MQNGSLGGSSLPMSTPCSLISASEAKDCCDFEGCICRYVLKSIIYFGWVYVVLVRMSFEGPQATVLRSPELAYSKHAIRSLGAGF